MKYLHTIQLAALILLLAGCGAEPTTVEEQPTKPAQSEVKNHSLGETVTTGDLEFTLKSIETVQDIGSPGWVEPAGPGETYVIAKFAFKNLSTTPIDPFQLPSVALLDSNGVEYGSDLQSSSMASDGDSIPLDNINPGITYNDTLAWKVVAENYDPSAWTVVVRSDPQVAFGLQ